MALPTTARRGVQCWRNSTQQKTEGNMRYVRKNSQTYPDSHCLLCGANYGICKGEPRRCRPTTCMACGSTQCMVNGLGRGQCVVCYVGLLPGWLGTNCTCSYKGCGQPAIARADGANRNRCRIHLERGKWAGYIEKQLTARAVTFTEVDDSGQVPLL